MVSDASMKGDHYFAEMLRMMRSQGCKDNPVTLQLGFMLSTNSVKIDDLILNSEDLYIADHLVAGYTRAIQTPYVNNVTASGTGEGTGEGTGAGNCKGTVSGKSCTVPVETSVTTEVTTQVEVEVEMSTSPSITFTDGLKKGDLVAVQKLNSTNKYVILAKVVSA